MSALISPVVLCILDGWGISTDARYNAISLAKTPTFDRLWTSGEYSTTLLEASGKYVGLPVGQIGNSEVGHLNIGAGRVVQQALPRITQAFDHGDVVNMQAFRSFVTEAYSGSGRVHIMGLASEGGVHAHSNHILALDQLLKAQGFDVVHHLWTDGRDVAPNDAAQHLPNLVEKLGQDRIASISGRYFSMDRDNRWDRVEQAYRAMVLGDGVVFEGANHVAIEAKENAMSDEFIKAHVRQGYTGFHDGDAIVCANFRSDRVREILASLLNPDFDGFSRDRQAQIIAALGMTPYSDELSSKMHVLFMPETLNMGLGESVSAAGKTQFRLAETEKYPHVTFFFNGGQETPYDNEDRHVVPSPKVATYDLQPEMSCKGVGDSLERLIKAQKHDLIIVNFANPDMVGHTGNLEAAKAACSAVDGQLGRAVAAITSVGGAMLVTADHGNCEQMWDHNASVPHTAHTTNPVPVILVGGSQGDKLVSQRGALCDLAPTLLDLLGIEQPKEMTGRSLLVR